MILRYSENTMMYILWKLMNNKKIKEVEKNNETIFRLINIFKIFKKPIFDKIAEVTQPKNKH